MLQAGRAEMGWRNVFRTGRKPRAKAKEKQHLLNSPKRLSMSRSVGDKPKRKLDRESQWVWVEAC